MSNPSEGPVRLEIDGQSLVFVTLADFEFCLDARTHVPAHKMLSLTQHPAELLHEEARNIRMVELSFTEIVAQALDNPRSLARNMRELDRHLFSQDFRWRSIIEALNDLPTDQEQFRHAAMTRYLLYLRSRQEVLRAAYSEHRRQDTTPALNADESDAPPDLRATSIFDVEDIPPTQANADGYATLPRGETITVKVPDAALLPIMLSGHKFELLFGEPFSLRDADGKTHPLVSGRNVVGRDLRNQVSVDAGYRDVSRRHLLIDVDGRETIALTDLSSHGTRVGIGER